MSYIYCDKCEWLQDDFWTEDYHPLKINGINELLKELLEQDDLENVCHFKSKNGIITPERYLKLSKTEADSCEPVTYRKHLINIFNYNIKRVENMRYPTKRSFLKSDKCCPICGSYEIGED